MIVEKVTHRVGVPQDPVNQLSLLGVLASLREGAKFLDEVKHVCRRLELRKHQEEQFKSFHGTVGLRVATRL